MVTLKTSELAECLFRVVYRPLEKSHIRASCSTGFGQKASLTSPRKPRLRGVPDWGTIDQFLAFV